MNVEVTIHLCCAS